MLSQLSFLSHSVRRTTFILCFGCATTLLTHIKAYAEQTSLAANNFQVPQAAEEIEQIDPAEGASVGLQSDSAHQAESQALTENQENLQMPIKLQDLAYGNILFDYYRGEKLAALNGILVAQKRNELTYHSQSARLLSGVIYLDLGMLAHAQSIFNELLTEAELKSNLLSRIEFYLGKLHYQQGDYPQATYRLERVLNALTPDLKDEALIMLSNIAIASDNKDKARAWLQQVNQESQLSAVSRFNLGMMWLREQNVTNALPLLTKIVEDNTEDQVIKSLQDKAYVALGYYHLAQQSFEQARQFLLKVRLNSPETNKAILGVGWSYGEAGNYNRALTHWLELAKGDIRDVAVQEALIAVPYAYQKLNAMQQALDQYASASNAFQAQINLIDDLLIKIEQGDILERFVSNVVTNEFDSIANDKGITDSRLFGENYDYYLYELIAGHRFNEGFRSYQKLGQLAQMLARWEEALPTFTDILETNSLRFEERIPAIDAYLAEGAFEAFQQELAQYEVDIQALKNNQKLYLLADESQLETQGRISRLLEKINRIPESMLSPEQRLKAERARGVFQWQLESGKVGKIWQLEKIARDIRRVLEEMAERKVSLANAREKASGRFSGYQSKIDQASGQLIDLKLKIQEQIQVQANQLKAQIVLVLEDRKSVLNQYLLQSDLSIARLHEKSLKLPELGE